MQCGKLLKLNTSNMSNLYFRPLYKIIHNIIKNTVRIAFQNLQNLFFPLDVTICKIKLILKWIYEHIIFV